MREETIDEIHSMVMELIIHHRTQQKKIEDAHLLNQKYLQQERDWRKFCALENRRLHARLKIEEIAEQEIAEPSLIHLKVTLWSYLKKLLFR